MNNDKDDLDILMRTLDQLGVTIKPAPIDSHGGLVRLQKAQILYINGLSSLIEKIDMCCAALNKLPLDNRHVSPRVRALLGQKEWHEQ